MKSYNAKGFYEKMKFSETYLLKKQGFGEDCYFFGRVIDTNWQPKNKTPMSSPLPLWGGFLLLLFYTPPC